MLEINKLAFRWPRQTNWQINIEHFSINRGEKVFLKGASGGGKSTLLGLISGINRPFWGEIKLLDTSLQSLRGAQMDKFRADHIGYIFQQFNLLPYLSVIENVLLPCHFSRARKRRIPIDNRQEARRLLDALALPASCHRKAVFELSIGQQQRVAAARALIGTPEFLLADEPTSALDTDNREVFLNLLLHECEQANITILFVSHDIELQKHFDKSISLNDINRV